LICTSAARLSATFDACAHEDKPVTTIVRQCCRLPRCRSSLAEGKECLTYITSWPFLFFHPWHTSLCLKKSGIAATKPCGLLLALRAALISPVT
jgi:hypothetical protein